MKNMFQLTVFIPCFFLSGCLFQNAEKDHPISTQNPIEIVAPAPEGGGWDKTARAMQKVLNGNGIITQPIKVVNKLGGGGEVGWKYLKKHDGRALGINSSLLITNHLLGQSKLAFSDFTPIAILATEWQTVAVAKNSNLKNAEELMKKLKKRTNSIKIGVAPGLGNDDQLAFVQAAKVYHVDPAKLNFRIYESVGDVTHALLTKKIDVATMAVSEASRPYHDGKINILAVTSSKRLKGLKNVPTWKEQGVNIVFPHWRGVMGPPNMSEKEIAYWNQKIRIMVNTKEWKAILKNNDWNDFYKDSEEARVFLEEQNNQYETLMKSAD